jgi:hypothetical protein
MPFWGAAILLFSSTDTSADTRGGMDVYLKTIMSEKDSAKAFVSMLAEADDAHQAVREAEQKAAQFRAKKLQVLHRAQNKMMKESCHLLATVKLFCVQYTAVAKILSSSPAYSAAMKTCFPDYEPSCAIPDYEFQDAYAKSRSQGVSFGAQKRTLEAACWSCVVSHDPQFFPDANLAPTFAPTPLPTPAPLPTQVPTLSPSSVPTRQSAQAAAVAQSVQRYEQMVHRQNEEERTLQLGSLSARVHTIEDSADLTVPTQKLAVR